MATNKKIELEAMLTYWLASKSRCPCILAPPLIYTSSHSFISHPLLSITLLGCAFSHPPTLDCIIYANGLVLQKTLGSVSGPVILILLIYLSTLTLEIADNMGGPFGEGCAGRWKGRIHTTYNKKKHLILGSFVKNS